SFEDAYVIARWLAAEPDDPVEALRNFRRVRIPRVHEVQRRSAAIVRAKHNYNQKAEGAAPANVDAVNSMAWIWSYDVTAEWNNPPAVPVFD
ncbi:MAG: hypothetical protein WBC94_08420, partial [Xanthobacteraceae bacterium]